MRVPISWLKDYVEISLPISELAEKLTLAGLEVEKIEYIGLPGSELPWDPDKIFVAQVLNVERHPNADKLLLVDLNYGVERQIRVVTGAPNLTVGDKGQKVVLALKGSRLYDGHKEGKVITVLKEASLRGVKNDSMVCSEKELGLSDEHDGIILLPEDAPVGTPVADYLGDAVLEVAILPNTIRCAGILGIAREVAALTGQQLRYPRMDFVENDPDKTADLVKIEIGDAHLNPRFTASIIKNVTQRPSPAWMQRRLKLCGIRAINNIVDVSNYVMLEINHPTHTFDFDALRSMPRFADEQTSNVKRQTSAAPQSKLIYTRLAEPGATLKTLDGKVRTLLSTDIAIYDEVGVTSLAGVMGGAASEVNNTTKNVLLEVAAWNNISIRRTARHHDLNSEASYRFARNLHWDQAMLAQKRALYLLQQLTGGTVTQGVIDVYPTPAHVVTVDLDPSYVNRTVGMEIPVDEMVRILTSLEFTVETRNFASLQHPASLHVTAPNHRTDIEGPHDLVEEIGRIYGYDRLPVTLMKDEMPAAHGNSALTLEERVKDVLVTLGLSEFISYRMTTPQTEARTFAPNTPPDDRAYVTLLNPINPERHSLRHGLVAGALETLSTNLRHHDEVRVFEIGSVYLPSEKNDGLLPDELPRLTLALSGARNSNSWATVNKTHGAMDFFDLKGVIEALFDGLKLDVGYESITHPTYFPGRSAAIIGGSGKNAQQLGVFGELHPKVREGWGLPDQPVLIADLDLAAIQVAVGKQRLVQDVPRFPPVQEDLAVIVDDAVKAADIESALRRAGGNLLSKVELFDVYRGEQVGAGKKSMAYSLTYQAEDRTLGDKDVEKQRNKIVRSLEAQLGATIRKRGDVFPALPLSMGA